MARHGLETNDCQFHAPSLTMMLLGSATSGFSLSSLPWQKEGSLFTARFGGFWLWLWLCWLLNLNLAFKVHVLLLQVALIGGLMSSRLVLNSSCSARPGTCSSITNGYLEKAEASRCKTAGSSGVFKEAHVCLFLSGQDVERHIWAANPYTQQVSLSGS